MSTLFFGRPQLRSTVVGNGVDENISLSYMSINSAENPLHIAVRLGHSHRVSELLLKKLDFALELNQDGYTPLHLACWWGHLEIVRDFIQREPKLCLVKDKYGRTPLHTAAMKGRLLIMTELLHACPETVMEVTATKETPLHVAATHDQLKAVRILIEFLKETTYYRDVITRKDCSGNTILHVATSRKQLQTLKLLLANRTTCNAIPDVNAMNDGGFTALDILDVLPQRGKIDMEIEKILRRAGAWRQPSRLQKTWAEKTKSESVTNANHALVLVATLLATITFHAALNPPGGRCEASYIYRSSISGIYQIEKQTLDITRVFILLNSVTFFTSIAMIIILMHELPLKPCLLISVFSMLGAYVCSIIVVSPREAVTVFLVGSLSILLAGASRFLALHRMVLKYFQRTCIKIPE